MANPVETFKREKHGLDVWPDVLGYARTKSPMKEIPTADLERMKWYGVFYRKRDAPGSYMLRIRITANELSATQAKEVARIAYEYGYGIVDLTTRANIQVQGLHIEHVPRALERLAAVGLTTKQTGQDNVRNVFCHPLSGVDAEELIDVRPLCREITELFLDHRDYADLPRKFNIAICGRPDHATHFWTQDLSFLAIRHENQIAFCVAIGGKQGQSPQLGRMLPIVLFPEQVVPFTRAILDLFRDRGAREKRDAARFHFLIEHIGIDGILEEVAQRLDFPLERVDELTVRPSGYDDLVGWHPQRIEEGTTLWALGLSPALGRMSWEQLEGAGLVAERWGSGRLRTTPEQGLIVLDVESGDRDAMATQLAHWNLSAYVDSRVRSVRACTGKQFCNIAVTETKAHALQLIEQLRQRSLELHGIHIHMNGCPSSCANHHTADIGLKGVRVKRLLGTREGFDVILGGGVAGKLQLGMPYQMGVDVHQLPNLIEEVVREYYLRHAPGESFSEYWRSELRRRQPAATKEEEFQPPLWECDRCGHRHAGEDPPVYCPKCAALRRHFARWEHVDESLRDSKLAVSEKLPYVAEADSVPQDGGLLVEVTGKEVALFRVEDRIDAIDNECPHAGGSLAEGTLENGCIACPLHGWKFDTRTGQGIDPVHGSVASHATTVEAGKVYVHLGGGES